MRILLFLFLLLAGAAAQAAPFKPFESAGIDRRPGAQVNLDIVVRDEKGRAVTLRALGEGKPMIFVPVQHNCPNICGVTLGGLASAVLAQPYRMDRDFTLVAFGIDPEETPADADASLKDLRKRLPELAQAGGLHAVTAGADDIAAVTHAIGYRYAWDERIGQYAHIAATAVLTRDGRLSRWLYGIAPDPTDLRLALTEAGEGRIGSFTDQLLLLCYHYDPQTGRYGTVIWTALRVGGIATALGLAGFIVLAIVRERRTAERTS